MEHPDSLDELVKSIPGNLDSTRINPRRGDPEYDNNCTRCAIVTYLRSKGIDCIAKGNGGKPDDDIGVAQNIFKNPNRLDGQIRTIDGNASTFAKSKEDAAKMLINKFGQNAAGSCAVRFKNREIGHVFNFFIEDGKVRFIDGQAASSQVNTNQDAFWDRIDPNGSLKLAVFSDAELNVDELKKYAE